MRLREDDAWIAGRKRAVELGAIPDPRKDTETKWWDEYLAALDDPNFESAKEGDVWVSRWWRPDDEVGPIAGYTLTCPDPACEDGVHSWTQAGNCGGRVDGRCPHYNVGSCWEWTGSPEDGTLTASPSLYATGAKCRWHGFLRNGVMSSV